MEYRIRTEGLVKKYKNRTVVNEVSINFTQGEIVGLLGPNGAGKTTSFYMIVGLIKPFAGKIFLNDTDITDMPMYKRAQLGLAYLPQEASVFRQLTVEDNIKAILEFSGKSKQEQKEKLESLIAEFNIEKVRRNKGNNLSGGERRRVEIARCLASDPKFIGIVITGHNGHEALSITDRAYLLFEGSVLKSGTAEELAADPMVKKVYLGANFELRK